MFLKRFFNRKSYVPISKKQSIFDMSDVEYAEYWKEKLDKETDILVSRLLSTGNYISLGKYVNKEYHNFYILTSSKNLIYKTLYAVNSETVHYFYSDTLYSFEIPCISYKFETNVNGTNHVCINEFHTYIKNKGYGRPLIEKVIDVAIREHNAIKITGKLSDEDCKDNNGNFQIALMEYRNNFYAKGGFTVISDECGNGSILMDL